LLTGIENAFLIGIAALLTYMYPFTSITAIVLIAYLKWKGLHMAVEKYYIDGRTILNPI